MKPLQRLLVGICLLVCFGAHGQIITAFAGNGSTTISGDGGPATAAGISWVGGGDCDRDNNYYFCSDVTKHIVRMIDAGGIIHLVAGNGVGGYSGDNGPATNAQLSEIYDVIADDSGNIFIADSYNYRIRKVDAHTHIITTIVGNGVDAYSPDGVATSSSLQIVYGLCFDRTGNLYFSDSNSRIRKLDHSGMLTTVVGNGTSGFSGDNGPATNASISTANGLCVDRQNNLYFADSGGIGHIRKVDLSTGIITRFAGNGHYTFNGDSINADTAGFICSYNMKCDVLGNIYFSEYSNHRVRVIDNNHIIHTIAGTGVAGYSGDNGSATFAEISHPSGVALDTCGNVYIADYFNKRIRKVSLNPNCWPLAVDDAQQNKPLTIYPNPAINTLHIDNLKAPATYYLYDVTGRVVATSRLTTGANEINTTHLSTGIYLIHLLHNDGTREVHKIVKD